jgi:hypothetical protein
VISPSRITSGLVFVLHESPFIIPPFSKECYPTYRLPTLAIGLRSQAQRGGLRPAYILFDSWSAAAQLLDLLDHWGGKSGTRRKSTRTVAQLTVRTQGSHRYGRAQGKLSAVSHLVLGIKAGRRYWGTTDLRRTPREVKGHSSHRRQIEATFRLLKQEFGWGSGSCQKHQAPWAYLHLGLSALLLPQQAAFARAQTMYAFQQSFFVQSIPQNPLTLINFYEQIR